jgi:endoglucanase
MGTSRELNTYSYEDRTAIYGTSYYRLKQQDFDGQFEYSKIISSKCIDKMDLKIHPNPTDNLLKISGYGSRASIMVTNNSGLVIMRMNVVDNFCILELGHLPAGLYIVSVANEDESVREQIQLRK